VTVDFNDNLMTKIKVRVQIKYHINSD
jgi:hypothetical protein